VLLFHRGNGLKPSYDDYKACPEFDQFYDRGLNRVPDVFDFSWIEPSISVSPGLSMLFALHDELHHVVSDFYLHVLKQEFCERVSLVFSNLQQKPRFALQRVL